MQRSILSFCCFLFFALAPSFVNGQTQKDAKPAPTFPQASQVVNSKFTYNIISAPEKTFGYDILVDGKIMIHQPNKPGMGGIRAFDTKLDAEKVAKLVVQKMKNGEMPPSVTPEELKKLKVIKP